MSSNSAPVAARGTYPRSAFGMYMVFCTALLVGIIVAFLVFNIHLSFYLRETLWPYRWLLGYNVIDRGTAWQWTFNTLLWGALALPLCRWILGFMKGACPSWHRMLVGYAALGVLVYVFGLVAYHTDIDRTSLIALGLAIILTAGYAVARWICHREGGS